MVFYIDSNSKEMRHVIYLLLVLVPVSLYSQRRTEGHYYSPDGSSLFISNDTVRFYPSDLISINQKTPSIGHIRKVSNNLYEVAPFYTSNMLTEFSISYGKTDESSVWDGQRYVLALNHKDTETIKIVFDIPYDKPLIVKCLSLETDDVYVISKNNNTICIPKDSYVGGFSFSFTPQNIHGQIGTGRFFGRVEAFLDCVVLGKPDVIHISIPELNSAFFEDYQIDNGFILIKKNSLIWIGKAFYRTD